MPTFRQGTRPTLVRSLYLLAGTLAISALAGAALMAGTALAAPHDTTLVSRAGGMFGLKGNGHSSGGSISADGRVIAFESRATNLSPADSTSRLDVYVRDERLGVTTLVSRASGANGAKANGYRPGSPAVSADGHVVAFMSNATNLSPSDNERGLDVYVRDLDSDATILVSRASGPLGVKADQVSGRPSISKDGRYVAFLSSAQNLGAPVQPGVASVYVRDLELHTTTLVSRASGAGGAPADASSADPVISDDGRHVAFASNATNLSTAATDPAVRAIYVRDLQTGTTTLASRAAGAIGAVANGGSKPHDISADGRRVVFTSSATNLDPADSDADVRDVYVSDLSANITTLVSRASGKAGGKGDGHSDVPAISADGRAVAFTTTATNLTGADRDPVSDVYVRDLQASTTTLASRASGAAGAKGNSASLIPDVSSDGRSVAFHSRATNLKPGDTDDLADVFVRRLDEPAAAALGTGRPR
jgi:TolB protein